MKFFNPLLSHLKMTLSRIVSMVIRLCHRLFGDLLLPALKWISLNRWNSIVKFYCCPMLLYECTLTCDLWPTNWNCYWKLRTDISLFILWNRSCPWSQPYDCSRTKTGWNKRLNVACCILVSPIWCWKIFSSQFNILDSEEASLDLHPFLTLASQSLVSKSFISFSRLFSSLVSSPFRLG